MKKKLAVFAVVFFIPGAVFAASVHLGDYFLKGAEQVADDVYVFGRSATFAGNVDGDVVAASESIFSQSDILGDVLFLGEDVRFGGSVEDARIVGAVVTVDGTVLDDAVIIGSRIIIEKGAKIEGSLYAVGGSVDVRGAITGNAKIISEKAVVSGTIAGDLEQWGDISFSEPAAIGGDFIRHSRSRAGPRNVAITGKIIESTVPEGLTLSRAFLGGFFSLKVLMLLALGFALFFIARERTENVLVETLSEFWLRMLRGLIIIVVLPVIIALLISSVVGLPIAMLLIALFVAMLLLSWALAGIIVGAWIEQLIFRRSSLPLTYRPVLLGILVISVISLIPYVGPLFYGILILASVGSLGTLFFRALRGMP